MAVAAPAQDARPPGWPMYRALVGVGVICALLIVTVYLVTGPVIARNEAEALRAAVFRVLPGAAASASFTLAEDGSFRPVATGDDAAGAVHAGYDAQGELVGIAIQAQGMGYQDVIRILYGYDPRRQLVIGMQVLASKETPGLGDKIEKDSAFLANFEALDVSLAADGQSLAHPVVAVKSGEKSEPWQVDGITGATISSKAIAAIVQASGNRWLPLLYPRWRDLEEAPGGDHGQ